MSLKGNPRHRARCVALQALYQWAFEKPSAPALIQQFIEEHELRRVDKEYFKALVQGVVEHVDDLDETIKPCLDRKITALNPVELVILRLAVYEFKYQLDVPFRVVINEALELAKNFGAEEGYKYVNAVLDALVPKLRASEI